MRGHPAQKAFEIDLSDALAKFNAKTRGRSTEAQQWKQLFVAATLCGFDIQVLDVDLVVVTEIQNPDKDMTDRWTRNRDLYCQQRAIVQNDINSSYPERWQPNSLDLEIMKDLGISV